MASDPELNRIFRSGFDSQKGEYDIINNFSGLDLHPKGVQSFSRRRHGDEMFSRRRHGDEMFSRRRHGDEMFSRRRYGDEIGGLALTAVPAAAKQIPEVIPLQVLRKPGNAPVFTRSRQHRRRSDSTI